MESARVQCRRDVQDLAWIRVNLDSPVSIGKGSHTVNINLVILPMQLQISHSCHTVSHCVVLSETMEKILEAIGQKTTFNLRQQLQAACEQMLAYLMGLLYFSF